MISVSIGIATDTGRVRRINEDGALAGPDVFAVADGMGGYAAGDVASAIAIQYLRRLSGRPDLRPADLQAELAACNEAILAAAGQAQGRAGMGTTAAGLVRVQLAGSAHWLVFNVGDSRVYRILEGGMVRVTVDHSEVEELIEAGSIDAATAREHPRRNVVTRALGMRPAPEADVWVFPPTRGERFLICTDGLHSELADDEITDVLRAHESAAEAAQALVARAVRAGGRDNVTVVVVDHLAAASGQTGEQFEDDCLEDTLQRAGQSAAPDSGIPS